MPFVKKLKQLSIVVENISKYYGQQKALDNISFEAFEGEILGLLGPNGAGKTSIMKIISCFMPASSGKLSVYGHQTSSSPLEIKKILGYLPEHNPLYGTMYVKEYLSFVAKLHKLDNISTHVREVIEKTGLTKEQHKTIDQLSKGYKQRVGIAQAIIHKPRVLILDEPISGLDPNQIIEIRSLIKSLKKNTTVIFSSHILQEVESLCDRIVILDNGKIVSRGTSESTDIDNKPWQQVFVEIGQSVNDDFFSALGSDIVFEKIDERKFILKSQSSKDLRQLIFDHIVKSGLSILEMYEKGSSLENLFKSVTKSKNT
jgi:ABC-2 type transport system ATP-binding protein